MHLMVLMFNAFAMRDLPLPSQDLYSHVHAMHRHQFLHHFAALKIQQLQMANVYVQAHMFKLEDTLKIQNKMCPLHALHHVQQIHSIHKDLAIATKHLCLHLLMV